MTCAALLRFSNQLTRFPIHVDTIIDWIKANAFQDEISLIRVPIDKCQLLGMFRQYTYHKSPYGDPVLCTEIIYPEDLEVEFERLVVVKELLHIFDRPEERVTTSDAVQGLIQGLVLRKFGTKGASEIWNQSRFSNLE